MKDLTLVTYTVAELTTAKRFFSELIGADPYVDSPGDKRDGGGLAYWTVPDIAATVQALVAAGGTVVQDVTDVAYGLLVASVKDPNGATVGLRQFPKG